MAGLPFYELKKTLEFYSHKCDTAYVNDEYCSAKVRTQSITGHDQRDLAVVERSTNTVHYNGISDKMYNELTNYKDRSSTAQEEEIIGSSAQHLRSYVEDMLSVRNGDMSKTLETCKMHKGTICQGHRYSNYKDLIQASTGIDLSETEYVPTSSGDIYNAIPLIPYCTCNIRFASECVCQKNTKKDHCSCHQRTSEDTCYCRYRSRGKYDPDYIACACNVRVVTRCSCVGRTPTSDCTCDGRCSCNGRKEFSYQKPNYTCICNTKSVEGCSCDAKRIHNCSSHYCDCYSRSSKCIVVSNYPPDSSYVHYQCRKEDSLCDINLHGWSGFTGSKGQEYGSRAYETTTCACKARCSCDGAHSIYTTSPSTYTQSYNKTECTCRLRGGENYSTCTCNTENDVRKMKFQCNCEGKTGLDSTQTCTEVDKAPTAMCDCLNRTAIDACTANKPPTCSSDEDGGSYSFFWCTCESRKAEGVCHCNVRTACDCVYRTSTRNKTLDVYKDILKMDLKDIQVP